MKRRFTRVYTKPGPPGPPRHRADAVLTGRNKNKTRDDDGWV